MAEADEGAAGLVVQLGDRGGRGVEQLALDGAVAQLLGVQLRRRRWQPFEPVVVGVGGDKRLHERGAVGVEPVPDDDQRPADLPTEGAQSADDLLAMDAAAEVAGVQSRLARAAGLPAERLPSALSELVMACWTAHQLDQRADDDDGDGDDGDDD